MQGKKAEISWLQIDERNTCKLLSSRQFLKCLYLWHKQWLEENQKQIISQCWVLKLCTTKDSKCCLSLLKPLFAHHSKLQRMGLIDRRCQLLEGLRIGKGWTTRLLFWFCSGLEAEAAGAISLFCRLRCLYKHLHKFLFGYTLLLTR